MKQTKRMSIIEAAISTAIGFGVSLGAQMIFLPLLGVPISHAQNFAFAGIMTVVSVARQFGVRRLFEALHIRTPLSPFMLAVIAERGRQVTGEGWTADHDNQHATGELARAGGCYAIRAGDPDEQAPTDWPWRDGWWKPSGFRRDLVKAGALILAEGERFDRLRKRLVK